MFDDESHTGTTRMIEADEATLAGQAVYSRRMLGWYDFIVLTVSNRWIWRCPTSRLLSWYDRHVSNNHLDVGVGTGWFLAHCKFPTPSPKITLLDLNENCLASAADRIRHLRPATVRADVLRPLTIPNSPFDSIGVNYLLHCLPGDLATKACVFDHLGQHLAPDGVLFGSTLLCHGVTQSWAARRLAAFYNRKRIFSNDDDRLDVLTRELKSRFHDVTIETCGSVALFTARQPIRK